MTNEQESEYRVGHVPQAAQQIRALATEAASSELLPEFFVNLRTIARHLKIEPLEWGDPEYRTQKRGGVVCDGISGSLLVVSQLDGTL